jgi:hypothetical protein
MISLTSLTERGLVSHEIARIVRTQDGTFTGEVMFSREQAAAMLAVGELHKHLPTLQRPDLLALYRRLSRAFKHPSPAMTYDIILSARMKLQLIPRLYLSRIDVSYSGAA